MPRLLALIGAAVSAALFFALGTSPRPSPSAPPPPEAAQTTEDEVPHSSTSGAPISRRSRFHGRIVDVHTHLHPASLKQALALLDDRGQVRHDRERRFAHARIPMQRQHERTRPIRPHGGLDQRALVVPVENFARRQRRAVLSVK